METLPRVVDFTTEFADPDAAGHRVVDIACGSRQTLVLCANGDLFWWGQQNEKTAASCARRLRAFGHGQQLCRRVAMGHSHALLLVEQPEAGEQPQERHSFSSDAH